ncbi:MAG TPA: hypothetical protein VNZ57_01215 [Longimicrobiales bacterium]|nr:hypothetical protein [Longimicrobiales bacterium]
MAQRRWIRLDVGWSNSDWLVALNPGGRLAWIELLGYVKVFGSAGRAKAMGVAAAAKRWDIPAEDVQAMLDAAIEDEALQIDGDVWVVVNWNRYQDVDATAAERNRRYRQSRARLSPLRRNARNETSPARIEASRGRNDCRVTSTSTSTVTETDGSSHHPDVIKTPSYRIDGEPAVEKPPSPENTSPPGQASADLDEVAIATRLERWQPDAACRRLAARLGKDIEFERAEFLKANARNGTRLRNPNAAFRRWLEKPEPTVWTPPPGSEAAAAQQREALGPPRRRSGSDLERIRGSSDNTGSSDEEARIREWEQDRPEEAERLRALVAEEVSSEPAWRGTPEGVLARVARARYRTKVLERLQEAARP